MLAISVSVSILTHMEVNATSTLQANLDAPESDGVDRQIRRALGTAIRRSAKSREQIAEELSLAHDLRVSVHMLNNWTGDSKRERRVPAEVVPALCAVLGDDSLQKLLLSEEQRAKLELGECAAKWLDGKFGGSRSSKSATRKPRKSGRPAARTVSRP